MYILVGRVNRMQKIRMVLLSVVFVVALSAQTVNNPTVTRVMATLSVNKGVTRDQIMKVMSQEVRDTVQLHLDAKIDQWFARADGKGVVFLLNCKSVEEAKAVLEELPLIKDKLATFEYMALGPLTSLRMLLAPAAK